MFTTNTMHSSGASKMHISFCVCLFLNFIASALTYSIPEPKVQILSPKGVRLSIPHENGIALVAFHVNIGKPIGLNQPGEYSADITQPTDGRWIFDNTRTFVDSGDKINYWLHVQYGNYAFRKLGSGIASGDVVDISETSSVDPPTPTVTVRPISPTVDCEPSKTTVYRKTVCKGQLIFEDNFDQFNHTMWKHEVRIPLDTEDDEFVSYQGKPENCYVNNGELHIVPSLQSALPGFSETDIKIGKLDLGAECTGFIDVRKECSRQAQFAQTLPPVVSARIRSKDFFSFRYGKVEIRAKLPKGDWLFPLILLEPHENNYGISGYASGQMRVAFNRGNEVLEDVDGNDIAGNRVAGGVVLSTGDTLRDIWLKGSRRQSHLGDGFHTYTLTWTDAFISLEIDGSEYALIQGGFSRLTQSIAHATRWSNNEFMAPFDREFYLTLGVSAGGHSDFPEGCRNGIERKGKPWQNRYYKAELHFWNDRANWLKTWKGENIGLHVDYVRVYAL